LQRCAIEEALEITNTRFEHGRPDRTADRVVQAIAPDGRRQQQQDEPSEIHLARRAKRAADEKQRVARQERQNHEPRLAKDDEEKHRVHPRAILIDEIAEKRVDVQHQADEMKQRIQMHPF
jgi:hypothetical protein